MRRYLGPARSRGGWREQPAGFMLCWKGVWRGQSQAAGGRSVLPEEREASAGRGLGEGLGDVEEPGGEGAVGGRRLY